MPFQGIGLAISDDVGADKGNSFQSQFPNLQLWKRSVCAATLSICTRPWKSRAKLIVRLGSSMTPSAGFMNPL
jgi:hypothetical protein